MNRTSRRSTFRVLASVVKPVFSAVAVLERDGTDNLPDSGGFVVAVNHLSELDPFSMAITLYDHGIMPRFLAKDSLFAKPALGPLLRHLGMIPVSRGRAQAKDSLVAAGEQLREGGTVVIYPEGTVTRDPALWPMRGFTGAARLALQEGVPVVPVAHWGEQRILYRDPRGKRTASVFPRQKIRVSVGAPIAPRDLASRLVDDLRAPTVDELTRATSVIMERITALLADIRGEQPPSAPFVYRATKGSP